MKHSKKSRIATLMVHTSPLDQAGIGDAGGMNVYVVESAKKMAQRRSMLHPLLMGEHWQSRLVMALRVLCRQ